MGRIIAAGDSTAVGIGEYADQRFARVNAGYAEVNGYIRNAVDAARAGDTIVISGYYNSGFTAGNVETLTEILNNRAQGVEVVIAGLREDWPNGGGYAHLAGQTDDWNRYLREVAEKTGSVFSESSIDVANRLGSGEIHGGYEARFNAAMRDLDAAGPGHAPAAPEVADTRTADAAPPTPPAAETPAPEEASAALSEDDIRAMQGFCRDMGKPCGAYGPAGDGVDGKLGNATLASMAQIVALSGQEPAQGDALIEQFRLAQTQLDGLQNLSREEVMALQMNLKDAGHQAGNWGPAGDGVDGKLGGDTIRALVAATRERETDASLPLLAQLRGQGEAAPAPEEAAPELIGELSVPTQLPPSHAAEAERGRA